MAEKKNTNKAEFIKAFGAMPPKTDIREYKACVSKTGENAAIPEEFELTMPDVKNQLNVASCVAHAIATTVEYFNSVQEDNNKKFSTAFIYGNRRNMNQDKGMYVDCALNNTVKYGDVYREDFDGNYEVPQAIELFEEQALDLAPKAYPHRFSSFFRLTTEREIKLNLMQNGPVVFSIPWYSDYYVEAKTYIMRHSDNRIDGYHAMVIYGWNKDGWKIQNSWGTTFGKRGRAILPYGTYLQTCYGIKDEITSEQNSERVKELEKELEKLKAEIKEKDESIQQLTLERQALIQEQADRMEAIENAKKEYENISEILTHDDLTDYERAEYQKKLEDLAITIKVYQEDVSAILLKLSNLMSAESDLIDEVLKNVEIIKAQNEQIEVLKQQLLDVEKPFKKMPRWLALLVNSIINAFK